MLVIVILLQKSFRENVVVAKTSYQMLGILSFSDEERALRHSTGISELTAFVAKKNSIMLSGYPFLEKRREKVKKCVSAA